MNPSTPDFDSQSEAPKLGGYEAPAIRLLGNVHDLLAMAKCNHCDGMDASAGEPDGSDHGDCPH
jgi:hypothetical protein